MKTFSLVAALVVTLAGPAFAQSTPAILAIEQSNQSAESVMDVIDIATVTQGATVPTDGDTALSRAMDLVGDDNGLGYASVFPSEPGSAADVFARLASE